MNWVGVMGTEDTIDKIVDAAMVIVRDQGVGRLTLDRAAQQAGLSKGGVLYHFKTKNDLIHGMVSRLISLCEELYQSRYDSEPAGPYRWARAVVRTALDPSAPVHDPINGALLASLANDPVLAQPLRDLYQRWTDRLRSDSPNFGVAALVCMAMDGLCFEKLIGLELDPADLQAVMETALALLA